MRGQAMNKREKFCELVIGTVGAPVLWGARGPTVFDCSGLVAWALHKAGGPDWRRTHNAQRMANELPATVTPEPGDLAVYGGGAKAIIHVVVLLAGGHLATASGARSAIITLADAQASGAQVRLRQLDSYNRRRGDLIGYRSLSQFLDEPEQPWSSA
jgi:murein DD-endopeptidase